MRSTLSFRCSRRRAASGHSESGSPGSSTICIVRHQQAGGDRENLISLLLASQETGPDTITDQVRDAALTILLAGHDTIATALVWTWILLSQQPDAAGQIESEVRAVLGSRMATAADVPELVFTRAVLAESLRLRPPAWVVARSSTEDLELGGIQFRRARSCSSVRT